MTRKRTRKEKNKDDSVEAENNVEDAREESLPKDTISDEATVSDSGQIKRKKSEKRKSPKKTKKELKDEIQYEAEEILDEKMVKGVRYYLIHWKGYDEESDTWEPESTLECEELIKKFKEQKSNDENESPRKGKKEKHSAEHSEFSKKSKKGKSEENGESFRKGKKSKKDAKPKRKLLKVDWESDDEFEVDRILDVYFKKNGKTEFLVSWKGYPTSEDSWEPEENLDCVDLIEKFMNKVQKAKSVERKELRLNRTPTERFTLNMYAGDGNRRLSRRLGKKQRVQYREAE
ncbi:hypothetical protein FQA39_LY13356 [Lamprigera yunnana]|nr:hypothetical protein FQA39_LY13356 [Lamprigera yunnana]